MRRRWTACLLVCVFMVGLAHCLIADLTGSDHGSMAQSAMTETAQACGTSVVQCKGQFGSHRLLLVSFFTSEQNTFYEGVSLTPPLPPPRG